MAILPGSQDFFMSYDHLLVSTAATGVRTITVNRPERLNAVNQRLADELPVAIDDAARDDSVRVIVITGAGRGFCAGLDLSEPPKLPDDNLRARLDPLAWVGRWVLAATRCEKPLIAAINGPAAGAGFGLALAADIRLVARGARVTAGYVRRGLSPDAGVSYLLPRLIGLSRATEILLSGRDVDAEEALDVGLAAAVFDDAGFADQVTRYAERLAAGPPIAIALTKRLLASTFDVSVEEQLARELVAIKTCFASQDVAEAIRAFGEKRAPAFRGR
ncbi:MAG TPA: enoyl-CoA hydratase-related protein [Gemmatimonadaceae bacterium]|nr:enoyl-CoA hydratase-related protein [Gemmatimonadaceae bacterium]